MLMAPISIGELVDKITILQIKQSKTQDQLKLSNINTELELLQKILSSLNIDIETLKDQLYAVNLDLWHIEDYKRACEKEQNFDDGFVNAARQVYLKNDLRAEIKREINLQTNSLIVEEKIY